MTWLITGGAGYIGAHVVKVFDEAGIPTVVLDDLSTGIRTRVPQHIPFVEGTILDAPLLDDVISQHRVTGIVHIAGKKSVPESVERPDFYHRENVGGTQSLLDACSRHDVRNFVFSSSAAVYGMVDTTDPLTEEAQTEPNNPYGQSKLDAERSIEKVVVNTSLRAIVFRYFNVWGAASDALEDVIGDNLFPVVRRALKSGTPMQVFGTDFPTRDGTAIRDYVHVLDIAEAHLLAAENLDKIGTEATFQVMNLGTGTGSTVLEVIGAIGRAAGENVPWIASDARDGDTASSLCNPSLAVRLLNWRCARSINDLMCQAMD